ncbi:MAG TPA: insulinase family protein, partial [Planctomycetota bacterium]|nr:insulinase family protein [Planctomycetota bacterium]
LAEAREVSRRTGKNQTTIVLGYPGLSVEDGDRFALDCVDAITSGIGLPSGWLHNALRGGDRSLVYFVHALPWYGLGAGSYAILTRCNPDDEPRVLELVRSCQRRAVEGEVTDDDLERGKSIALTAAAIGRRLARRPSTSSWGSASTGTTGTPTASARSRRRTSCAWRSASSVPRSSPRSVRTRRCADVGMSKVQVQVTQPHGFAEAEARARLERAMDQLAGKFPGYNLQRRWEDERKAKLGFTFSKNGKGEGTGSAVLAEGRVEVVLDALYNLPFLVPVALAQKLVRDEITKLFAEQFR